MRIEELIDGLIYPEEESSPEDSAENADESDNATTRTIVMTTKTTTTDSESTEGAAAAASLLKLRTEGLARLELIREHYSKAHALLCPQGLAGQSLSDAPGTDLERNDGYSLHLENHRAPLRHGAGDG
jgi:RNA polymerase primary sigma factor